MIAVNEHILNSYPRGKDYTDPILFNCDLPYRAVTVDLNGECFLCRCDAHLPVSVGNISNFNELSEIWSNPIACRLQKTVDDHSYTYCAVTHCGIINSSQYIKSNNGTPEYYINFSIDDSCNLACASCRRHSINYTSGPVYEKKLAQVNHFVKMLNIFNDQLRIILTGNGDPLASLIMRPIILNWIPKQHQTIILFTNGLLMKKLLPSSSVFNHISEFRISVDAGSDNVYEQVRFPGKFNILQENLSWLAENKSKATQVRLMFCLSSTNAHDIMNFVNMCSKYGFRGEITRVENWFTFDNYEEHNVAGNPGHRLFSVVKNQLQEASKYSHIHITPILKPLL